MISEPSSFAPANTFAVPTTASRDFVCLPEDMRAEIRELLGIFVAAEASPRGVVQALEDVAASKCRRGWSGKSLYRKYNDCRKHGWTALIDRTKVRARTQALPAGFIQEWKRRCENNQRKCRPAYDELVADWQSGKHIPGYGTWRDLWREQRNDLPPADLAFVPDLPHGWSYANLMRHAPTKFELTAMRQGRGAARVYRPGRVLTTRVGLEVGQYYMFDDVWNDNVVIYPGAPRPVRTLQLSFLDMCSGCVPDFGLKPQLKDEAGTKQGLVERDMRFFMVNVLLNHGYRADVGTTLMVELGTATIREDMEGRLMDMLDKKVRVERASREGRDQFAGMFEGRSGGNPNYKAALESWHNLWHNRLGSAPAQIGMNPDHQPEQHHGLEKYAARLLAVASQLPPEVAERLMLPALRFDDFHLFARRTLDLINKRTDHALEGWLQCGFTAEEFRLGEAMPWAPLANLAKMDPAQRGAVEAYIRATPGCIQQRKLSPWEVWRSRSAGLTRISPHLVPMLLGRDLAREDVKVDNARTVAIQDKELGGEFLYEACLVDADMRETWIAPGTKFSAHINPYGPDKLFLSDARGAYVGYLRRQERIQRGDASSLHSAWAHARKVEAELSAPMLARHAQETREKVAAAKHNAELFREALAGERPADVRPARGTTVSAADREAVLVAPSHDEPAAERGFGNDEIADLLSP